MKYLKYILIIILIFSFAMVSCKKDSTTESGGGTIEGAWNVVDVVMGWLLTTNSNQTAINMFDVTGQVSVTGVQTATFDFMLMDNSTDPPSFVLGNLTDSNSNSTLVLDGATGEGMLIANGQMFLGDVTYNYNNGMLTITQSTLTDAATATTVTISGTLSYSQTNISANTPTFVEFIFDGDNPGEEIGLSIIKFNNDGTATVTTIDEYGTEIETWDYTTDGNQMTITDEYNDVMVFEYSIVGNVLTLVATDFDDYCGDYVTQAECLADTELFFGLTPGSLTAVSMQVEIILNQAVAKQGLDVGETYNLMNPYKAVNDFKLKVQKMRESL